MVQVVVDGVQDLCLGKFFCQIVDLVIYFGGDNYFVVVGKVVQGVVNDFFVVVVGVVICGIEEVDVVFNGVLDKWMVVFFWKCSGVFFVVWFVEGYVVEVELGNM